MRERKHPPPAVHLAFASRKPMLPTFSMDRDATPHQQVPPSPDPPSTSIEPLVIPRASMSLPHGAPTTNHLQASGWHTGGSACSNASGLCPATFHQSVLGTDAHPQGGPGCLSSVEVPQHVIAVCESLSCCVRAVCDGVFSIRGYNTQSHD